MQLLVVGSSQNALPQEADEVIRALGWTVTSADTYQQAIETAKQGQADAVLINPLADSDASDQDQAGYAELMACLQSQRIVGLIWGDDCLAHPNINLPLVDVIGPHLSPDELRGRLTMIQKYHAVLQQVDRELDDMQRLSHRLREHFQGIEEDMCLAGRLQKDFLPDLSNPKGNLQFQMIYQPASWVSGDIFNVFSIDADHTAFYLSDAVGHGMAASLLTMFINRTLIPTAGSAEGNLIHDPADTLSLLNQALIAQDLPNCQFVTAWYGLFNHTTGKLQFSRAGHPYPLLIKADGTISEIKSPGGLLGVFDTEEFKTRELQLEPGDRLLLYTDGVEHVFPGMQYGTTGTSPLIEMIQPWVDESFSTLIEKLEAKVVEQSGSLAQKDDVTFLGIEVLE